MGLLSAVRDVVAILRDLLLIAFFAAALFGVITISSAASKLGEAGLPGLIGSGQLEKSMGAPPAGEQKPLTSFGEPSTDFDGEKITDPGLVQSYREAKAELEAGNTEQGLQQALARLEEGFSAKGMGSEVNTVRNLRKAIAEQDTQNIRRHGSLLEAMFGG